jgi:hypothetical protein
MTAFDKELPMNRALLRAPRIVAVEHEASTPVGFHAITSTRRAKVVKADGDCLTVICDDGREFRCDLLEAVATNSLKPDDAVLVVAPETLSGRGVVVGRIVPYASAPTRTLALQAGESLSLRCGDASIDLRSDGKVMIRGDDVLVRAKGTHRIRAGTVSVN